MKYLILTIFTVLCKPGTLYTIDGETELQGERGSYYYYNLDLNSDGYLYVSWDRDSVWFYVEQDYIQYLDETNPNNIEFEIKPK